MKRIILNSLIVLTFIFNGCDKPLPTQIKIPDGTDNDIELFEVISPIIDESSIVTGLDSTGYILRPGNFDNEIFVSKNIVSEGNISFTFDYGQAIFFDKSKPVMNRNGKLICFHSKEMGNVKFKNFHARKIPMVLRIKTEIGFIDSTLGPMFVVGGKRNNQSEFQINYNETFDIETRRQMQSLPIHFDVTIPEQKILTASWNRNSSNRDIILNWNNYGSGSVEIILGVILRPGSGHVPVYRIKTRDDGTFIVKNEWISNLLRFTFEKFTLTLIKRNESSKDSDLGKTIITAQTTFTIVIDK